MVRLPLSPEEIARGRRLGALLREARDDRSILEVALDARVSPETLRKIETGRIATPAFSTVAAVAQALGLSLDGLWSRARTGGDGRRILDVPPPSPMPVERLTRAEGR